MRLRHTVRGGANQVMEASEPWSQQAAWQALLALRPRLRRFATGLTGSLDQGGDPGPAGYERGGERPWQWEPGTRFQSWGSRSRTACGSAGNARSPSVAAATSRWIPTR